MKKSRFSIFLVIFSFFSCSLKYNTDSNSEAYIPEFVFSGANLTRYKNGKKEINLSAGTLEQYKDGKNTFSKDIDFTTYDSNGEAETTGHAGYMSASSDEGIYKMFDSISIINNKENMEIQAGALKWNEKNEQLTSSREEWVTITKDDTTITGKGFSASGVSRKFAFENLVSGTITTEDVSKEGVESQ